MTKTINITPEAAAIIPYVQLEIIKYNPNVFTEGLKRLSRALEKCPDLFQLDYSEDNPCMFHYYCGETHLYICEYNKKDSMYGYRITDGDLPNAKWGYINLTEIRKNPRMYIDFHFPEQTMQEALYKAYPDYYFNPNSLQVKVWETNRKAARFCY